MPFILSSENIQGACFRFIDNDDSARESTFLTKRKGKIVRGTLALQIFDDKPDMRITFIDPRNLYSAAAKRLFNIFTTPNYLCHFDFNQRECDDGKKLVRFECMLSMLGSICLMCYDFTSYEGCSYLFNDRETAKQWADAIGIKKMYLYDANDHFDSMVEF